MFPRWLLKIRDSADDENRRVILNLMEPNNAAVLLDTGCGNGHFTRDIAQRIGTCKAHGLEVGNENINRFDENSVNLIVHDLNKAFPLPSDTYDVVVSNQVIEHLYNTDLYIKQIYRVLKRGDI